MTTRRLRALATVVIAVALSVFASAQTFAAPTVPVTAKALPAVDLPATPAGWVPVAYGDAQISVPAGFNVFYLDSECGSILRPGTVLVGDGSVPNCSFGTIQPNGTLIHFSPLTRNPAVWKNEKPMRLNGLSVYLGPGMDPYLSGYGLEYEANDYIVPSLDIEVAGVGPLAKLVLNTVTRSPRAVALASGASPVVPSSWQQVTSAGVRFSVPPNWPISRTEVTPGLGDICKTLGVAFASTAVTLSTDARPMVLPPCAYFPPTPQPPENGVQVDSGLRTEPMVTLSFSAHCLVLHGLTSCPATSPAFSILVLRLNVPGRDKPVFFSIGLAGNGMVARTILYSLGNAASPSRTVPERTGVVTGVVQACEGVEVPAGEIIHVKVRLYSESKGIASQTVVSGTKYRFSVSPGTYRVTDRWGSKVVTVRAGRIVTANFWNSCV
jgi:hypothetical protein